MIIDDTLFYSLVNYGFTCKSKQDDESGVPEADLMGFWWYMLICDLIIPVAMIICGRMMWKHCPKNINGIVGYRTARSMKNMDTWKFAHDYYGKLLWKIGWFLMIPSALILLPLYRSSEKTLGTVGGILTILQCIVWIVSIVPTEKALKKLFNEDGTRK